MALTRKLSLLAKNICSKALSSVCGAIVVAMASHASAATCNVAVAANFTEPAKEITQLFAGYLKEPHFPIRTSAIFALGTRGDASAIPALEAALNRDDLSIEMAPMIKSQIEHLKNSSAPGGAHGGAGSGSASSEKNPGDQRWIRLEQLVQEMNDRLKAIEGRLPPAAKP